MRSQDRGFLCMALGFALWMAALSVLYGLQAAGCALLWQHVLIGPVSLLRVALLALFAAFTGLLLWLLSYSRKGLAASSGRGTFLWRVSVYLTLAAVAATVWIGLALPLPSMCDDLVRHTPRSIFGYHATFSGR